MKKRTRKSVSDSTLMKLWRQAVLIEWGYCDPLSGHCDPSGESLQCHHIVGRRHFLLRWDVENGVPLTVESHILAHKGEGRARLRAMVKADYLDSMERYTAKQWLHEHGMTENEFRLQKRDELQAIIREGGIDEC